MTPDVAGRAARLEQLIAKWRKPPGPMLSRAVYETVSDCAAELEAALTAAPAGWKYQHEHESEVIGRDGWMCEQHPGTAWPHDDCAGPGMPWMITGKAAILRIVAAAPAGETRVPDDLRALLREWQAARQPVTLDAPGVGIGAAFQAASRRMAIADEALAAYDLDGPAGGALVGQSEPTESTDTSSRPAKTEKWKVSLTCCGYDAGFFIASSWEEADRFREAFTSGGGVAEHGYSAPSWESGHRRSGVITTIRYTKPAGETATSEATTTWTWCAACCFAHDPKLNCLEAARLSAPSPSPAPGVRQLQEENARLIVERDEERVRRIVAEQHKTLSLLGKSSYQEVVEEQLRTQLAEAQVENDRLRASAPDVRKALEDLMEEMLMRGAEHERWLGVPCQTEPSRHAMEISEWRDRLSAILAALPEAR